MRFLVYAQLRPEKGVPYSDRHLKRLESKGLWPKRRPFVKGGTLKGWSEEVIDRHLAEQAEEESR